MDLIKDLASINKAIKSIANRGAKLDTDIQLAGLSVLAHIDQHGNVEVASKLFDALPKGARRNALAQWLITFGKLRVLDSRDKADQPALKAGLHFGYHKDRNTDLTGAAEKPWHQFKQEKSVQAEFNVQDKALRFVVDAVKHGTNLDELLAAVQAAIASDKAKKAMQEAQPTLPADVAAARAAIGAEGMFA
jgi:hypothetical protein